MSEEARKLHLIGAIIHLHDQTILKQVEDILLPKPKSVGGKSFAEFAGILTKEEGNEMLKAIHESEGCGHPDCYFKKLH